MRHLILKPLVQIEVAALLRLELSDFVQPTHLLCFAPRDSHVANSEHFQGFRMRKRLKPTNDSYLEPVDHKTI